LDFRGLNEPFVFLGGDEENSQWCFTWL